MDDTIFLKMGTTTRLEFILKPTILIAWLPCPKYKSKVTLWRSVLVAKLVDLDTSVVPCVIYCIRTYVLSAAHLSDIRNSRLMIKYHNIYHSILIIICHDLPPPSNRVVMSIQITYAQSFNIHA